MPGGKPPGGIGIPSGPGVAAMAASVADFRCTKLRLFGKSSVSAPELRSRMSTGFGQLVEVISTRNDFVPAVYSKALVSLPWTVTARIRPSKATAADARVAKHPRMGRTRWMLWAWCMANSGHVVRVADAPVSRTAVTRIGNVGNQPGATAGGETVAANGNGGIYRVAAAGVVAETADGSVEGNQP